MKRLAIAVAGLAIVLLVGVRIAASAIEARYNRVRRSPPYGISEVTNRIPEPHFIADLHADSLLWGRNLLKRGSTGHVDVPRLEHANVALQVFSVVTTIPRGLNIEKNVASTDLVRYLAILQGWPTDTWNSPKQRALYQARRLQGFAERSGGRLVLIKTRSDLNRFTSQRDSLQVAAILASEGAQPLEGRLDNLDPLYEAGFRIMSPTHFTDTEIGGSASGENKGGLTDLGRHWVRAMESKGMLIDLAHASPATLRDVTAMATRPVIVSHTGVKSTCNNNRNLSDDELRALAQTGGLVGIGYWETAVCGRDAFAVSRAIRYAASVVGVQHVCLGSDFDGATTMPFDVTGLPLITDALREAGFSERDISLVMGENVRRFMANALPE
jgi:microsomal dipeptidase-like Zn-dependent dipeptidase